MRRRSRIEEYAPVIFGGLLLMGAFGFAGHYLGRNADAHNLAEAAVIAAAEPLVDMQAMQPKEQAPLKSSSLLPEGERFDLLNTKVIDSEVIESDGKTNYVMEDRIDVDEIEPPKKPNPTPLKAIKAKPEKKVVAKAPVQKLKIEPAAVDLEEEVKKPVKRVSLAPVQLVKPEKLTKPVVEKSVKVAVATEKPMNKAEKQRAVVQRRIRLAEENCLARAVYFEARGESELGQLAVAKVIINRTKNPSYPKTICGVVYQGSQNRNSCQFSFACDGQADEIRQPAAWSQAKRVANKAISGDSRMSGMSALNYHADYVKPKWSKTLRRLTKIGTHIFYR